jgi:hypothetical protein
MRFGFFLTPISVLRLLATLLLAVAPPTSVHAAQMEKGAQGAKAEPSSNRACGQDEVMPERVCLAGSLYLNGDGYIFTKLEGGLNLESSPNNFNIARVLVGLDRLRQRLRSSTDDQTLADAEAGLKQLRLLLMLQSVEKDAMLAERSNKVLSEMTAALQKIQRTREGAFASDRSVQTGDSLRQDTRKRVFEPQYGATGATGDEAPLPPSSSQSLGLVPVLNL